MSFCAT